MLSEKPLIDMPSLVAFDLDGTTLDHGDRDLHPRVQEALARVHGRGAATAVVSGRPLQMLRPIQAHPWVDWLITMNGSLILRSGDEEVLDGRPLLRGDVELAFATVEELGAGLGVITKKGLFHEKRLVNYMMQEPDAGGTGDKSHAPAHRKRLAEATCVESTRDYVRSTVDDIYKLQMSFPDPATRDRARVRLEGFGRYELADMGVMEIEITARGVNKGTALDRLCERAGIDQARAVAFGDSGNDMEMAGHVGTLVAMGNATPEFKAVADEVCPPISEQGVARWLEERICWN